MPRGNEYGRIHISEGDVVRTYTITEAAEITGLSRKAIARRVERGSLRSVVRNGRRRVPRSELVRANLLEDAPGSPREDDPFTPFLRRPAPGGALAEPDSTEAMLAGLFREVLDRFERQSQEIAQYRALTVQAESLRLTNELAELRVRLADLERQPQSHETAQEAAQTAAQHEAASDLGRRVSELTRQVDELSRREAWPPPRTVKPHVPQGAVPMPPAHPPPTARPPQTARQPGPPPRTFRLSRTKRFVLEALFIVVVAVVAWQAELSTPAIAIAMGLAWTLVAVVEWVSFRT